MQKMRCRSGLPALLLLLLEEALLGHPHQPVQGQGGADVEDNIHPHEAEVPPPLVVEAADAGEVHVGALHGAQHALRGGVGVLEVAAHGLVQLALVLVSLDPVVEVLGAGPAVGGRDPDELVGGADNVRVGDGCG